MTHDRQSRTGRFVVSRTGEEQVRAFVPPPLPPKPPIKLDDLQDYDLLTRVRTEGAWEEWLEFFLSGVKETADEAISTARRILERLQSDGARIEALGRQAATALQVFRLAQTKPILSTQQTSDALHISFPTASAALENLQKLSILREVTGKQRGRLYAYDSYLTILGEGTEPLR